MDAASSRPGVTFAPLPETSGGVSTTTQGTAIANSKVASIKEQVDEVKTIMKQNVERVLERGERLEDLMDKSTDLEQSSSSFSRNATRVKRQMCRNNLRCNLMIAFLVTLAVIAIVLVILYETGVLHGSKTKQ